MDKPQFLTQTKFDIFDLPGEILKGLEEMGLEYCTPIQASTLPVSLAGKDVAGQAQTGTGKTAAFLITIFSRLLALPREIKKEPLAMIVAPTRELAFQIHEEAAKLSVHTDFRLAAIVGGVDYGKQARLLESGTDIIIGTPGRIIDYYKKGILKTENIQIVVIDEADRLLDLGFAKDMRYILKHLPHYEKRQSLLFSATLSYSVMELTYDYMNLPEFISVTPNEVVVDGVEQVLYHVGNDKKVSLLLGILQKEEWVRMLIFVNTRIGVDRLTRQLKGNKWPAEGITGDLPQKKRFQLMEQFKSGKLKILVATDVASRGIHVEDISHVVNYDLPQDSENFVHRIGRTARAGKKGKAISLACEEYVRHLEDLEKVLGYKLPVAWPEDDWFLESKVPLESGRRRSPRSGAPRTGAPRSGSRSAPGSGPKSDARPRSVSPPAQQRTGSEKSPAKATRKTFPGSFFGFGPPEQQPISVEKEPEIWLPEPEPETPEPKVEVEPIVPGIETDPKEPMVEGEPEKPKPKTGSRRRRGRYHKKKKPSNPEGSEVKIPDEPSPE
ncbi:MAG: DEAD/DEAH box helicase [Proteobacteria bacterium]|nr:DEAD/DEAH box helicase [Pseudomonadota bacterium]